MAEPSPGQVITPGGGSTEPPNKPQQEVSVDLSQQRAPMQQPVASQPTPVPPASIPTQPASPVPVIPADMSQSIPVPPPVPELQQSSQITNDNFTAPPQDDREVNTGFAPQFDIGSPAHNPAPTSEEQDLQGTISWTASEYIAHQKSPSWYALLALSTAGLAFIVYFLTHGDIVSVVVIVLAAIIFGVYAGKKPKEQQYTISPSGISVGEKTYRFTQLKTFSIIDEGAFSSITFWPLKRFMPAVSIYYDPQDEEKIVEVLSSYLPLDAEKRDAVDNLMRKIRF